MNSNRNQFAEEIFLVVCLCLYLTEDESEPFLLDIKGLVCDFSGAVINQSQLEAAERRRTHLIFDACDLHKLLVLENKAFSSTRCNSELPLRNQTDSVDSVLHNTDGLVFFISPAAPFSSRAACPG